MTRDRDDAPLEGPGLLVLIVVLLAVALLICMDHVALR